MTKREKLAKAVLMDAGVVDFVAPNPGVRHAKAKAYAHSIPTAGLVFGPHPRDDEALAIIAHEAGHIATKTPPPILRSPQELVEDEFRASRWGIEAIRRHGTVTPAMQEGLRGPLWSYVAGQRVIPSNPAIVNFLNGADL